MRSGIAAGNGAARKRQPSRPRELYSTPQGVSWALQLAQKILELPVRRAFMSACSLLENVQ